ncbi:MAG: efflux RND transporter periplasmic adaptor subunit [Lawsonibacter sp.]|nr:efflux RND transporter periplasmic adaptor subunit [Oscillospiraceae bacterium]
MTFVKPKGDAIAQAEPSKQRKWHLTKPKHGKRWLILSVTAVLLLALAGKFLLVQRPAAAAISYTEESVAKRTITNSLTGSGTLQPANSYTVTTLIEGEVLSANFEEGETVEADTVLYEIDSDDAAANIEKAQISLNQAQRSYESTAENQTVQANSSGTLYTLEVKKGDEVSQGQTIATIRNDSTMTLTVPFPAEDAATFYVGQAAQVTLDGSFETLSGTVETVSGSEVVGTGNTVTRKVTIAVQNPGGLSASQVAAASVNGLGSAGNGTFTYQSESTVTASASGTVTAVHASEGSTVSKGQTLITLGGDDLEDQLQNAADSLRNAELSMENTQKQLENYTITSPISGTIIDKEYKAGDTVESGKTLCTIYDLSYLEMTLSIDELDISTVEVGQAVQITADAVEGKTFTGTVTKVSVAGTTSGGITSYPVTVRIDEADELLPGMNVDAEIVLEEAADTLAIPSSAVTRGSGNTSLVLVTQDSPSAANAVEQEAPEGYAYVQVETGISDDSYVQILSGLQEGDTAAYVARSTESGSMMMGGMPGAMGGDMPAGMPSGMGGAPGGGMPSGGPGGGFPG